MQKLKNSKLSRHKLSQTICLPRKFIFCWNDSDGCGCDIDSGGGGCGGGATGAGRVLSGGTGSPDGRDEFERFGFKIFDFLFRLLLDRCFGIGWFVFGFGFGPGLLRTEGWFGFCVGFVK